MNHMHRLPALLAALVLFYLTSPLQAKEVVPPPAGDQFPSLAPDLGSNHLASGMRHPGILHAASPLLMESLDAEPSLAITLQDGIDQVRKGDLLTYAVTITNQGDAPARACSLTVILSPGLVINDPGEGMVVSPQKWLWSADSLAADAQRSMTFKAYASDETTNPVSATAIATAQNLLFQEFQSTTVLDIDQLLISGSIYGTIWQDIDHDGQYDSGEPALPGIKIDLWSSIHGIVASDTSNADGEYEFRNLPIGSYQTRPDAASLPEGWDATTTIQDQWLEITDLEETHLDIELGYYAFETPVELTQFTAQARPGMIELSWVTESETENMGFHLYRSTSEQGPFERITGSMISGAGSSQSRRTYSYTDAVPATAGTYVYRISDISYTGVETMHGTVSVTIESSPGMYKLEQNYPNPFNGSTVISFTLQESGLVRIAIHNILGQIVRVLIDEVRDRGEHRLQWDGRDDGGTIVPAGVYIYIMQADQFRSTRKLQFIR